METSASPKGMEHPLVTCSLRETAQESGQEQQQRSQTPPPTQSCPNKNTGESWGHQKGKAGFGDQLPEQMGSHTLLHLTHGKNTALPQPWGYHFTWKRTHLLTSVGPKNHLEICMKNLTLSENKHTKILPCFLAIISSVCTRDA